MKAFFDTNVLVYAFSNEEKRSRAQEVIAGGGVTSAQVLNEFTNVLRKKLRRDWADIEDAVDTLGIMFPDVLPLTTKLHRAAMALAKAHKFSFYDALIVAAALESGCDILYSEDLHDGHRLSDLEIVNPFKR